MYINRNEWQDLSKSTAGFGQYRLVEPQRIMWETPFSVPMSVTGNDAAAWAGLGGFGEPEMPSTGTVVAVGVGSLVLSALSLVLLGGVVIWVVKSIRKG